MTTVILAEKPSQAKAYAEAFTQSSRKDGYYAVNDSLLDGEAIITYGFGHLVELAATAAYGEQYAKWDLAQLPLFPATYQFAVSDDKKKQFNIVTRLLEKADTIIVATDSDREGENIAWSIMTQSGIDIKSKILKRLWVNSLEKDAIRDGFANLRDGWDYYPYYQEAQTRQISDWLVGMNASPLYSLSLRNKGLRGVYSIGRVQTPTLYLVYQRDLEIKNFKPTPYVELLAAITASNAAPFKGRLEPYQKFMTTDELGNFMRSNQIGVGQQPGTIADVQKESKHSASPRLFSLSSLQSEINKLYHASASEILAAVQSLYEAKLLTYPRTDSNFITEQEFSYLVTNLTKYQTLLPDGVTLRPVEANKRYVNGAKVQEHHAIIVTKTVPTADKLKSLSELEQQVYDLVLKTTMAMFTGDYEYEETSILTRVGQAIFKTTGRVPGNLGWKQLFMDVSDASSEDADEDILLPPVTIGQVVQVAISPVQKQTKPPMPYTEGTLITAMKTAGKTVADEALQDILKETEGIGTEATRANVLESLKSHGHLVVEKNKLHVSMQGITLCQVVALQPLLTSAEMTATWEKALKEIGMQKRTQADFLQQIKRFIQKLVNEVPSQLATDAKVQRQINAQVAAQATADAAAKLGTCPKCHMGQIVARSNFYGCDQYKTSGCDFSLPKQWSGKALTQTAVKDLITTGRTKPIDGFTSKKTGKKFKAVLVLKDGKLSFEFKK